MSLTTWLGGATENNWHYNNERDLSCPRYVDWKYYPPTFIVQNIAVTETYDVKEITDYVLELFNGKAEEFLQIVIEITMHKLKENINLSVQEAVALALEEIDNVYGGSASDLITGGGSP